MSTALFSVTGPKALNLRMCERAKAMGMRLAPDSLIKLDGRTEVTIRVEREACFRILLHFFPRSCMVHFRFPHFRLSDM